MILRDMGQVKGRVRTLNFRRANFQLFKELMDGTPWEAVLRDKGAEQSWQLFKDIFLEHKSSQFPPVRNQARKAGDQHG